MKKETTQAVFFGFFMLAFYALRMAFGNEPVSTPRIVATVFSCTIGAVIFYFAIRYLNKRKNKREE